MFGQVRSFRKRMAVLTRSVTWKRFYRSPWRDILQFGLLVAVLAWLVSVSSARLGYNWQWYRVPSYLFAVQDGRVVAGALTEGLLFTLRISAVSLVCSLTLGLSVALLRLSDSFMGRLLSRVYLEVIRNTPLVVQMYLALLCGRTDSGHRALCIGRPGVEPL